MMFVEEGSFCSPARKGRTSSSSDVVEFSTSVSPGRLVSEARRENLLFDAIYCTVVV
jgi:hypothetical protein